MLEEPELEEPDDEDDDDDELDEEVEDVDGVEVEADEEAPSDLAEVDAGVGLEEPARLSVR